MPDLDDLKVALGSLFAHVADDPTQSSMTYLALKKAERTRWIVPANARLATPVLREWRPYKWTSRIAWRLLNAAHAAGALARVPGVERKYVGNMRFSRMLESNGIPDVVPVLYVGTPGPSRRVMAGLVEPSTGQVLGVLKIATAAAARAANYREHAMLRVLPPNVGPVSLALDGDGRVLLQTFISGKSVGRSFTRSHVDFLERLRRGTVVPLSDHLAEVEKTVDNLPPNGNVASAISAARSDSMVVQVYLHGDFAPWNLKKRSEHIVAIDWESASENGLPFVDVVHHEYIQQELFRDVSALSRLFSPRGAYAEYIEAFRLSRRDARALVLQYLLRRWCVAVADANGDLRSFLEYELARAVALRV